MLNKRMNPVFRRCRFIAHTADLSALLAVPNVNKQSYK